MNKGLLIIVSGPSGAGKGTICKHLIQHKDNLHISVSATTRKAREGEVPDVDYYFMENYQFDNMIQNNGFLEYAFFCGNYYGTPKDKVMEELEKGKDVILEIEVQGAMAVKEMCPESVFVFVVAPTMTELKRRLEQRNTENKESISKRLRRAKAELNRIDSYDYVLLNDDAEQASKKLAAIIEAEKCSVARNKEFVKGVLGNNDISVN